MRGATRVQFAALATVPFVMVLSNSLIIPVLPDIQKALHRSLLQIGLLITVFSFAAGLVIPVGGYLSDRYGRKAVMIPSLLLFGLGGLLAALAPVLFPRAIYTVLLTGRIVQGIGAGGTYQVAMALAGDLFQSNERSKALGMLEASNGLGKVASPIIGAAIMLIAWYAPFFLYPLIAWVSALLVWKIVKEPKRDDTKRPFGSYLHGLGKTAGSKGISIAAAFLSGSIAIFFLFGVLSFFSDILEKSYNVMGVQRGLVIAIPVAVMAITSYISGTVLVGTIAKLAKVVVLVGLGVVTAAFVGMFIWNRQIVLFTACLSLMGLGNGILLPSVNTMITSATASATRGTVTALYGTVRFFGAALGPPVFDRMIKVGPAPTYLGSAGLALVTLILSVILLNQRTMLEHLKRQGSKSNTRNAEPAPTGQRGDNRLT